MAQKLFTTVKRGIAIAKKFGNGSSNHGEPFFLEASPNGYWDFTWGGKDKNKSKMKYKL